MSVGGWIQYHVGGIPPISPGHYIQLRESRGRLLGEHYAGDRIHRPADDYIHSVSGAGVPRSPLGADTPRDARTAGGVVVGDRHSPARGGGQPEWDRQPYPQGIAGIRPHGSGAGAAPTAASEGGRIGLRDEVYEPGIAVEYRDHWYFISDSDHTSKRTFVLMQALFLAQAAEDPGQGAPVLTLPLN